LLTEVRDTAGTPITTDDSIMANDTDTVHVAGSVVVDEPASIAKGSESVSFTGVVTACPGSTVRVTISGLAGLDAAELTLSVKNQAGATQAVPLTAGGGSLNGTFTFADTGGNRVETFTFTASASAAAPSGSFTMATTLRSPTGATSATDTAAVAIVVPTVSVTAPPALTAGIDAGPLTIAVTNPAEVGRYTRLRAGVVITGPAGLEAGDVTITCGGTTYPLTRNADGTLSGLVGASHAGVAPGASFTDDCTIALGDGAPAGTYSIVATVWRVDAGGAASDTAALNTSAAATVDVFTQGYRMVAADGGIFTFGDRVFRGSTGDIRLNQPIVGGATDLSDYDGYWIVASDGGVFAFNAEFHGSLGSVRLTSPAVEIEPTPTGKGYWIVQANGTVTAFGDAKHVGDFSGRALNKPIVGMAVTNTGGGYWLVGGDGGIFAFGDAGFFGSTGAMTLNAPVIDLAPAVDGLGYYLLGSDGGVFSFGSAEFKGSTGNIRLNQPVVAMLVPPTGNGYWLAAADGGIFAFGAVDFLGSMGAVRLNSPVLDLIH